MTRDVHNDSGDRAQACCARKNCNHIRASHKPDQHGVIRCSATQYDPFHNVGRPCRCMSFVEPKPKPIPRPTSVIKTRAAWNGDAPQLGDYLMSPMRPRYGYRILSVAPVKARVDRATDFYDITADRVAAKDVPKDAKIHVWHWNPRDRKKKDAVAW